MRRLHGEVDDRVAEEVLALRARGRQGVDREVVGQELLPGGRTWRQMRLVVAESHGLGIDVFGPVDDAVSHPRVTSPTARARCCGPRTSLK